MEQAVVSSGLTQFLKGEESDNEIKNLFIESIVETLLTLHEYKIFYFWKEKHFWNKIRPLRLSDRRVESIEYFRSFEFLHSFLSFLIGLRFIICKYTQ